MWPHQLNCRWCYFPLSHHTKLWLWFFFFRIWSISLQDIRTSIGYRQTTKLFLSYSTISIFTTLSKVSSKGQIRFDHKTLWKSKKPGVILHSKPCLWKILLLFRQFMYPICCSILYFSCPTRRSCTYACFNLQELFDVLLCEQFSEFADLPSHFLLEFFLFSGLSLVHLFFNVWLVVNRCWRTHSSSVWFIWPAW